MFCPNCGHKVEPNQKFCDNCGYALKKKNTETSNEAKDDDSVRSLSEIEKELNQEDPSSKKTEKKSVLQQAPAQKREYDQHNESQEKEPEMKTFKQNDRSSFQKASQTHRDEPLDDRTQVYSKNDFNPISQKPYKNNYDDPIKEPLGDPFKPTESELRAAKAKQAAEQTDPNDGFIHNMIKFAKNNAFISIIAVIIVAILLVFKRNYGFIALAVVLIVWFLLSQLGHGNETGANKALKRETSLKKSQPDNDSGNDYVTDRHESKPRNKKNYAEDRIKTNKKTTAQKIIIISSIIGFIASIGGPFLNGVSLTSTISTAANYTANLGTAQPTWITNGFSAIRLICFLSPIIALIAASFRTRGSIRLVRIFTLLPTILYAALYGALYAGLVNSTAITGQVAVTTNGSFGTSFYVLLITAIVSLIMSYTLRPKIR